VLLHQLDGAGGGKMAAFLVGGADLERGDNLAIALHLGLGRLSRLATIHPAHRLRPQVLAQRPIERGTGHAIQLGRRLQHRRPIRMAGRQRVKTAAQIDQRL